MAPVGVRFSWVTPRYDAVEAIELSAGTGMPSGVKGLRLHVDPFIGNSPSQMNNFAVKYARVDRGLGLEAPGRVDRSDKRVWLEMPTEHYT